MCMRIRSLAPAALTALSLAACAAPGSSSSPPAAPSPSHTVAAAGPCKLKTRFDYLVRTTQPGVPASALEIGNVDLANCTPALADFAATAGQAAGECTTIARARANPGYDVSAVPARPLRRVLMRAGPGC